MKETQVMTTRIECRCEVWSDVECKVLRVKFQVWSLKCGVWRCVECGDVWSVEWEV